MIKTSEAAVAFLDRVLYPRKVLALTQATQNGGETPSLWPEEVLATGFNGLYYIGTAFCDQTALKGSSVLNPAWIQSSASATTTLKTSCTLVIVCRKVLAFRSDQATKSVSESNGGRASRSGRRRCRSHHDPRSSSCSGTKAARPTGAAVA